MTSDNSGWTTDLYDLMCRYVTVTADDQAKTWLEQNVRQYASTEKTDVNITLTKNGPYAVEGTVNEVATAAHRRGPAQTNTVVRPAGTGVLFSMPAASRLSVCDLRGRLVFCAASSTVASSVTWNASRSNAAGDKGPGMYVYRLTTPGKTLAGKILVRAGNTLIIIAR